MSMPRGDASAAQRPDGDNRRDRCNGAVRRARASALRNRAHADSPETGDFALESASKIDPTRLNH
ncbi:hypothetical protein XarzCFBP7410_14665 [Xanthomonas arboricola pv. zantedeschiae]|nr:hypothetical protein XarzCFBP7410_14665 [Xanthomonas arboricola pv. zantedeschiae]PPU14284.1 hypothetical protein XarjCFBP1022_04380 [Xanthomonas arboricola]